MKKWNFSVIVFAAPALIFTMSGLQSAIGADAPVKVEKAGKTASSAETKMMNKADRAPKTKTMPNKIDKTKAKEGALAEPFVPGGAAITTATSNNTPEKLKTNTGK